MRAYISLQRKPWTWAALVIFEVCEFSSIPFIFPQLFEKFKNYNCHAAENVDRAEKLLLSGRHVCETGCVSAVTRARAACVKAQMPRCWRWAPQSAPYWAVSLNQH
jgi:hypothetical protein